MPNNTENWRAAASGPSVAGVLGSALSRFIDGKRETADHGQVFTCRLRTAALPPSHPMPASRIRCPPLARQLFCIERSIQSALRMQRPRCAVPSPWPQRLTASVGEHSSSLPAPHVGRIESADAARPSLTTQVHHGDGRTGRVVWLPQRQQRRCLRLASPPSPPHFASLHASSPSPLPSGGVPISCPITGATRPCDSYK